MNKKNQKVTEFNNLNNLMSVDRIMPVDREVIRGWNMKITRKNTIQPDGKESNKKVNN